MSASRIAGIDLARMLALFGMFAAHIVSSSPADGGVSPLFQVVAGRSSALFAVLAGLSIALVTRRAAVDPSGHRKRLLVRAAAITAIGLFLGLLGSGVAVILVYYGVLFCCALPVLTWSARPLAWLALGWGLLSPVASVLLRRGLPEPTLQVPSLLMLAQPVELVTEVLVTGYYPVLTWATFLFAGMALGRLDLGSGPVARRVTLVGAWLAVLALAVSALVTRSPQVREALVADRPRGASTWDQVEVVLRRGQYGTHPEGSWWWLGVWGPHSGSIAALAHLVGSAMLVLGICLLLTRALPRLPCRTVAGAGAMTLTLYSLHVVVLASPLGVRSDLALVLHCLGAALTGAAFAAGGQRGPLEAWVRSVTELVPLRAGGADRTDGPRGAGGTGRS